MISEQMEVYCYNQYEISNFAKPGKASVHNLLYWQNEEYAGVGAGAHGYVNGVRYSNIGPISHYMKAVEEGKRPILQTHTVTKTEAMEEEMILGLRKVNCVSSAHFEEKFQCSLKEVYGEELKLLIDRALLYEEDGYYKLSKVGLFRGNEVFQQVLKG